MGAARSKDNHCKLDFQIDPNNMDIVEASRLYYREKVLPVERALSLDIIYGPPMCDAEFGSPPLLLFLGPFSSGKTTMIQYMMNMDYPGMSIGPEPSTDCDSIILWGPKSQAISMHTVVHDSTFPYQEIYRFGGEYLNKCVAAYCPCDLLRNMIIVDTPGIMTTDKINAHRNYDREAVLKYWIEKADKIVLVFDVFKLDFSEDMRDVISMISPYENKCLLVLNKSDQISWLQLQRAQDELTWSLGRSFLCRDLPFIHIGSFWNKPIKDDTMRYTFVSYEAKLLEQINRMSVDVHVRRFNEVVQRAKLAQAHALISRYLVRRFTPAQFLQRGFHRAFADRLNKKLYPKLVRKYELLECDLPPTSVVYRHVISEYYDVTKIYVTRQQIETLNNFIKNDLKQLAKLLPADVLKGRYCMEMLQAPRKEEIKKQSNWNNVKHAAKENNWHNKFLTLKPKRGFLNWNQMKHLLNTTGLSVNTLTHIWSLADRNKDGRINEYEFYLVNWLIRSVMSGQHLPHELPKVLRPPDMHGKTCPEKKRAKQKNQKKRKTKLPKQKKQK
uniref:EH domain-containing protein n=1 Tax=Trichuris muris TaxID=70415 RepID=A0A5S6R2Q5_TRIMR